jgi:hypothetical protein
LLTGVPVESDAFLPGWRAVKNLDGHGLGRKIDEADWNFFCLAGEIKATVVGREGVEGLRRAVKQILANQRGRSLTGWKLRKLFRNDSLAFPLSVLLLIPGISNKVWAWSLQRILS